MVKRKVKMEVSTKEELAEMVKSYFAKGGTITVCPTRYVDGHFRGTLTNTKKVTK